MLSKWFPTRLGRVTIFRDTTIEFPPNRNVAVLGRNGSGKSTLVRMVGGAELPSRGRITVRGTVSWPLGLTPGFQATLTGRQNVRLVCRLHGVPENLLCDYENRVLDLAELDEHFDLPVRAYSTGMRARLGFALSMCFDFDYYLIDEALEVGDRFFREKSGVLLRDKLSRGRVIMVSHSEAQIRKWCDAAVVIINKQLLAFDQLADGLKEYAKHG